MIKKAIIITLTVLIVYSCKKEMSAPVSVVDNAAFETYKNSHFLETLWQLDPDMATLNGYHKYDSLMVIPNDKSRDALLTFTKRQMDSLAKYNPGTFSADNRIDYQMIQDYLDGMQWDLQQEKSYEWNPDTYNVINAFAVILNENYAPLAKRLRNFYQKMEFVPAYYKEAQKQIKNPVPELTALATDQLSGGISVFDKDFTDSLKKSGIPDAEQKQMLTRVQTSVTAINGFVTWLKALKNDHARNFRVGKATYENRFKYHLESAEKVQQLYNSAVDRKKEVHQEMAKLSIKLWPKYFDKKAMPSDTLQLIAEVIDTLSGKHVKPAEFQDAISKEVPELTSFVRLKDLLTIDDVKPLIIRKEPPYMAGVVNASVSAPGPYDKNSNIYLNVGSLAGWPADKTESYLREYNQYILQLLCIREAVPGHYIQTLYSEKSPSLIRSVLASDATVEGWAVYAAQMMLESGFGDNEPEMWLMWYKWHLRSVYNLILDHDVHAGTMTKEDAIKLLTHEAFQQPAQAEETWKRLTLNSVQLSSYFSGYKEIIDLRYAYKKKMGDKYNLKDFNDKFLSFGGAPVKYISEAMLAKPAEKKDDAAK